MGNWSCGFSLFINTLPSPECDFFQLVTREPMLTFMARLSNGRGKSRGPINSPRPPQVSQDEQPQGLDVKHCGIIPSSIFFSPLFFFC